MRELKRYQSRSQSDEHGLTLTAVAGGQWTRMRRYRSGYKIEPAACLRCKKHPETRVRRIWSCECNRGQD
eukprot:1487208-Pyramimonas_sp.AAC.1